MKNAKAFLVAALFAATATAATTAHSENASDTSSEKRWTVLAKYNLVTNAHNTYRSSSGSTFSNSVSDHFHFLGAGLRYAIPLDEDWSLAPGFAVSRLLRTRTEELYASDFTLLQISFDVARRIGNGEIFAGLLASHIIEDEDVGLKRTPGPGLRAGYRLDIGERSVLDFAFEFMTFKSENPSGGVFDQKSYLSSWSIAYGWKF